MSYSTGATDYALAYLAGRIRSGEWSPGDRIPTEDQLCRELGLSRIAVRQAIEKLASASVLMKVQGSGTYVNAVERASITGLTYYPVSLERMVAVLEFRRMFDPYNTKLFIRNAGEDEVRGLEANYRAMKDAGMQKDAGMFHCLDNEFHHLIALGTHNLVIMQLSNMLAELLFHYQLEDAHSMGYEHAIKYHGLILDAIREKNEELAAITCGTHIENAIKRVREWKEGAAQ